ncbi:MAG: UvrD-helicase domain-containing protein [Clostridia bacterium]|nr:UvrD-helicase domain-containing protein [Clostridia bacterium]
MASVKWTPAQSDAIYARGKSIAVSAAAGSGKTAVLTRRIIERVCAEDASGDISRILVVTFTKAAASELVSRISDALADELAKNPASRHIRSQSLLVSSAHISTIHSFCLDLIRTNFQKLDIPADFSAANEAEIELMMKNIAEDLISDYFEDELLPHEEKIEDFSYFADTFGDIARTDKLAETIIGLYKALSSTLEFLNLPKQYAKDAKKAAENGFDGSVWERTLRAYLIDFLKHYEKIYEDALSHIDDHDELGKYRSVFADEFDEIETLLRDAEKGEPYAELSRLLGNHKSARLPVVRGVAGDGKMNFYKESRSDFNKELKKIGEEYYSYKEEDLKVALLGTAKTLESLSIFMNTFERRFKDEKRRRRMITFADMERLALALLWDREHDAPTELARSMQEAYDEIYIDEYQDTNEIQDKIFTLVSKENNRFNVGDIKQSIYAFRGAEPTIFSALLDSRPKYTSEEESPAVKIYLSENFRSSAEILSFCNVIFEKLMNASAPRYGEDERLNCGSGKHAALPEVHLIPKLSAEDEEEDTLHEAEFVASEIARLLKDGKKADGTPVRPSDIVILLRSTSTSSAAYEDALKKHGIPCRNAAALSFFESPEVLLVLSLLSAIDNPFRDVPLAAALKSPLYGVTLDELIFIRKHTGEGLLMDALRKFTEETGFAKGGKFLSDLAKYAAMASQMPCDELIWQIYGDTGIFSILSADEERPIYEIEQAKSNLITLYDYARSFERGGFKGLSGFISFINEILENDTKMDISQFASPGEVVNIMTIHKSKGLEFPICFVSEMAKRFNLPEIREKTILNTNLGISVKLPMGDGLFRLDSPLRAAAILDRKKESIDEELRILYVALTRPKEKLYITASVPQKAIDEGKYDTSEFSEYRMKNAYFSAYSLRKAPNFLELILTSLAGNGGYTLTIQNGKREETLLTEETAHDLTQEADDMTYYEAKTLVRERLDYEYPYKHLVGIPSKLSVSKLNPTVLDESGDGVLEEEVELPKAIPMPHFLMQEPDEEITAAERGTAMHTFMQFCDFENVMEKGIDDELKRLADDRFLFPSDIEKMDKGKLRRFFESGLAKKMLSSKRIFREKRFMIRYPASLFTERDKELLRDETLLVQGVIDCAFFDEKGELILVDYKTDWFSPKAPRAFVEKTLRARHCRQLGYYIYACEVLFGVRPAHTYIYSFALDDTVEIYEVKNNI